MSFYSDSVSMGNTMVSSTIWFRVQFDVFEDLFTWMRVTRQGELLAQAGQTSALLIWNRVTRHLLHDCRMTPKWRQNTKRI